METRADFLLEYLKLEAHDPELKFCGDLIALNGNIASVRQDPSIHVEGTLRVRFPSVDMLMNNISGGAFLESFTQHVIGIWKYDEGMENYEQIYPQPQLEQTPSQLTINQDEG